MLGAQPVGGTWGPGDCNVGCVGALPPPYLEMWDWVLLQGHCSATCSDVYLTYTMSDGTAFCPCVAHIELIY
jgi:hypothetical protein